MACLTCNNECMWNVLMPCKVCELNNNDSKPKWVCHCKLCGAYICKAHFDNYFARTIAAVKSLFTPEKTFSPPVEELKTEEQEQQIEKPTQPASQTIKEGEQNSKQEKRKRKKFFK